MRPNDLDVPPLSTGKMSKRLHKDGSIYISIILLEEHTRLSAIDFESFTSFLEMVNTRNTPIGLYMGNLRLESQQIRLLANTRCHWLQVIHLENNFVGTIFGSWYISGANWPLLTSITLSNNNIGNKGLTKIIKANWPRLEQLDLGNINITDHGVSCLVRGDWNQLKSLDLCHNNLTNGALKLLSLGYWPQLIALKLEGTNIEPRCISRFKPKRLTEKELFIEI